MCHAVSNLLAVLPTLAATAYRSTSHNPPLADAVRCLFGDPFHPLHDAATWRTATAVADAAFDRLPVLADALEDGGCAHEGLLAHLRSAGRHQPGCHVLDVVFGRVV